MSPDKQDKIGFIGAGNMAEALIGGIIDGNITEIKNIFIYEIKKERADYITDKFKIYCCKSNLELVEKCDKIFFAVKPQNINEVLEEIKNIIIGEKLFITICAGIKTKKIEDIFNDDIHVVRVMPNTPALIKCGASAISKGKYADEKDMIWVSNVFNKVGISVQVDEEMLDAVTGLSGSGPAYLFRLVEAMIEGGVEAGLPLDISEKLVKQTVLGAARLVIESSKSPSQLREAVTSPGGTTQAGLKVMNEGGFFDIIVEAIRKATDRARELGKN